jgi:predicted PilT family ATPase
MTIDTRELKGSLLSLLEAVVAKLDRKSKKGSQWGYKTISYPFKA